ncbi:MAG: Smr/MutS family protein [Rhodomicrobiaceae bacterium]
MTSERRSRSRPLTAEEAELWSLVTREAKALRSAGRGAASEPSADETALPAIKPTNSTPQTSSPAEPPRSLPKTGKHPAAHDSGPAPLARFDERQRRRLAREAHAIEAHIDLHGMRQREAHNALRAFLLGCATRGYRHVLVITGKGSRGEIERSRDHFMDERGVLRRLVPQWLSDPEFQGMVLSYTTASLRHGGEGALYVRLRKSHRS